MLMLINKPQLLCFVFRREEGCWWASQQVSVCMVEDIAKVNMQTLKFICMAAWLCVSLRPYFSKPSLACLYRFSAYMYRKKVNEKVYFWTGATRI